MGRAGEVEPESVGARYGGGRCPVARRVQGKAAQPGRIGRGRRTRSSSRCPAARANAPKRRARTSARSEEHTSELQSLMRTSYAVFCLKKKTRADQHSQNSL